jgi:hypothetical protein
MGTVLQNDASKAVSRYTMVQVVSRLNRAIPIVYNGEGMMLPPRSPRILDSSKLGPSFTCRCNMYPDKIE